MKNINNTTELVFILDRSGSMSGFESDTIGGFNSILEKQKKTEGKCYVTTVLFDDQYELLHDRIDISEVKPLTDKDYNVRGCTALLDAVGRSIRHIAKIHHYARPEDVPEKTLFVITTDGYENASRHYDADTVKHMVEHEKEKYGWEFIFLGADIDAVETAGRIGIDRSRAANYRKDSVGNQTMYASVDAAITMARSCPTISDSWKDKVDKDFEARK